VAEARNFSVLHRFKTVSGTNLDFYPLGTRDFSPGVKRQECKADHLPPSSAKGKNGGALPFVFMA
jgi:hypothetical protein